MKIRITPVLVTFLLFFFWCSAPMAQQTRLDEDEDKDNPKERLYFEYLKTRNPKTGEVPERIRALELAFMRKQQANMNEPVAAGEMKTSWVNRGPYHIGGRTRALAVDIRNENIILAGGVSGGMWRSTDQGLTWQKTTGSNELQSVSCVAQDPTNPDVWYYGTGEFYGNSASGHGAFFLGEGVYKSKDNGLTWSVLPSTVGGEREDFDRAFDMNIEVVVDPTNGDLYVATVGAIQKSKNGGASFRTVLRDFGSQWSDIVVASDGTLYATLDSYGVFKSTNGEQWTDISPKNSKFQIGDRKELAVAPSNKDVLYMLSESWGASPVLMRFDGKTGNWQNRSSNLPNFPGEVGRFNVQGGYNMLIKVKPDDEDFVILGATNLYRSTDGYSSSDNTTWIGGYETNSFSYFPYPDHHSDQHAFVFLSGNKALSGNDGGVQLTQDITSSLKYNEAVDWVSLNNGYITTQVYALSAGPGDDIMAGFQDNWTWLNLSTQSTATWYKQLGGDGGYNAFNSDGTIRYVSSQRGNIFREEPNNTSDHYLERPISFRPEDYFTSLFIVPFYLDPLDDELFYLGGSRQLFINTQASTGGPRLGWKKVTLGTSGVVSEIGVSSPSVVYAGTSSGEVYRIENPGGDEVVTNITTANLQGGYVSAVAVDPTNQDHVLLTYSNYGIPSVFFTDNGGDTWQDVSGNLEEKPDGSGSGPSVRSATILGEGDRYFVGTSTGLYSTTSLNGKNTVWSKESPSGIGEVVVEHLVSRASDGLVLVGTHGNGVYSANFQVTPTLENDFGITRIISPVEELLIPHAGAVPVSIIVQNLGRDTQDGFDVAYYVNDELIASQRVDQALERLEEMEFTFDQPYDFNTAGIYEVRAVVRLDGDEDVTNDALTQSIRSYFRIEDFPFSESFDSESLPPPNWSLEGIADVWGLTNGETPTAHTGPVNDHTGGSSNYAYTEADNLTENEAAELLTPWLNIQSLSNPELEFYYHMFGDQVGTLEVIALDLSGNREQLLKLEGADQGSMLDGFKKAIIPLIAFKDKVIRIIFKVTGSDGERADIAIDDVRVYDVPAIDLAIDDIVAPQQNISKRAQVKVEITNYGLEAQSDFEVSYYVSDELIATETVVGSLQAGASVEFPFAKTFDFSDGGTYEIKAVVNLANDGNPDNDEFAVAVANLPFTGWYIMQQEEITSEGPAAEYAKGYLFAPAGYSRVFLNPATEDTRWFDAAYLANSDLTTSPARFNFELNEDGTTQLSSDVATEVSCGSGVVTIGQADTEGTYGIDEDQSLTLVVKENLGGSCGLGSPDVSFTLLKMPRVHEADSLALLALYHGTNGPGWNNSWNLKEPVFFWSGVSLSAGGRVIGLQLGNNNLIGSLSADLGELSELRLLDLSDNQLDGELPLEVWGLTRLQTLTLNGNSFSGNIPTAIEALTELRSFDLANNDMSGDIPTGFDNLVQLERLDLSGNSLEGVIPEELASAVNLRYLNLAQNELSGAFPEAFTQHDRLEILLLGENQLTELPDLASLNLTAFEVHQNRLDFEDLIPNQEILTTYAPQAAVGGPLHIIAIAGEELTLQAPTEGDENNGYQWFKNDEKIENEVNPTYVLAFSGVPDEGHFRCDITNPALPNLTLNRIIIVVDEVASRRYDFDNLADFYYAMNGQDWIRKDNWLTSAPFNTWYGVSEDGQQRIVSLGLGDNNMKGHLPEGLDNLIRLKLLAISNTKLTGPLPESLWNLESLERLELTGVGMEGQIPSDIGKLTTLIRVNLSNNQLKGPIPTEMGDLEKLEILDLSNNQLSGSIMPGIGSLQNLKALYLSNNQFTGTIPSLIGNLKQLEYLYLGGNRLTGEIPDQLSQLQGLYIINLSDNELSGVIPSSLGQLSNLEHLWLHSNKLSGTIPQELGDLPRLGSVKLQGNHLSGAIPLSFSKLTKLRIFDIKNNEIAQLPDLTGLARLFDFYVQNNRLGFDDLAPNVTSHIKYIPQRNLGEAVEQVINQGGNFTMQVSEGTPEDNYQWFRNGVAIKGANTAEYQIPDFQVTDQGGYVCEVTNPEVPDLILKSEPIQLDINFGPTALDLSNRSLKENEPYGTLVGELVAVDPDFDNDEFSFQLSGIHGGLFDIDGTKLLSAAEFNFENKSELEIKVKVTDKGGLSLQRDFTIMVINVNESPVVVSGISDQSIDEDQPFELTISSANFADEDGDELSLSVNGLPAGLSFDPIEMTISGLPLQADVGTYNVEVTATDPDGASATDSFQLTINNVNDAPVVNAPLSDQSTNEDDIFEYEIPSATFFDEDGETLSFSATGLPASLTFNAETVTISGTPTQADIGSYTIDISATDGAGEVATDSFELTVVEVNDAPVIETTIEDQQAEVGTAFELTVSTQNASDEEGDEISVSIEGLPTSFSFVNEKISGIALSSELGEYTVSVIYSDENGGSVTDIFVLTVSAVTSLEEEREYGQVSVQPNPFTNEIILKVEKGLFGHTAFTLQPVGAQAIWAYESELVGQTELTLKIQEPLVEGVYLLIVRPEGKVPIIKKVIKQD